MRHVRTGIDDRDPHTLAGRDVVRLVDVKHRARRLVHERPGAPETVVEREALLADLGRLKPTVGLSRDDARVERQLGHERGRSLARHGAQRRSALTELGAHDRCPELGGQARGIHTRSECDHDLVFEAGGRERIGAAARIHIRAARRGRQRAAAGRSEQRQNHQQDRTSATRE